jgi:hypothetical protein
MDSMKSEWTSQGIKMKRGAFFVGDEQLKKLKALSAATRIKASDYLREGIDMALAKYSKALKKAQGKDVDRSARFRATPSGGVGKVQPPAFPLPCKI